MSYYLADANGYLADWGSGRQLEMFDVWANKQETSIQLFASEGSAPDAQLLGAALSRCKPAYNKSVEAMRKYLIEQCKLAVSPIFIGDGVNDSAGSMRANVGNGSNQYQSKGADSTNISKAVAKVQALPNLSNNDHDFKAVPFPQGKDAAVKALEKSDIPNNAKVVDYDPSVSKPLATQDYVEAHKVIDIIKQEASGGTIQSGAAGGSSHEAVRIANFRGRDYIVDGHHRLTAALLTGKTTKADYYKVK